MTIPEVPRRYQGASYTRERYIEGWQDAQAGRPHAHASHAQEIIQRQGQAQYDAYSAGHAAGRVAVTLKSTLVERLYATLDELEQPNSEVPDRDQLSALATRLHQAAEQIEAYLQTNPRGEGS